MMRTGKPLVAALAALALAACGFADSARDVRTANRLLTDRQDPRFCADAPGGCPPRVPGHLRQQIAACAAQRAEAAWTTPVPGLPTTTLTFPAAMHAMDVRIAVERTGAQRRPAPDPADEDRAAARLTTLFNQAVEPCVAALANR